MIAWERTGTGPPLVLVHGTTADRTRWRQVLPAIAERYRACAVDRRGRGESGDAAAYALEREFEDVAAVIVAIGERVMLLGHSYGALCALEAPLLTANVRKLVLYEPPITLGERLYPARFIGKLQAMLDAGDP